MANRRLSQSPLRFTWRGFVFPRWMFKTFHHSSQVQSWPQTLLKYWLTPLPRCAKPIFKILDPPPTTTLAFSNTDFWFRFSSVAKAAFCAYRVWVNTDIIVLSSTLKRAGGGKKIGISVSEGLESAHFHLVWEAQTDKRSDSSSHMHRGTCTVTG